MIRRRGPALVLTYLTAAILAGCAGAGSAPGSDVAALRLARTGHADEDAFFRTVHTMQLALNESERVKVDAVARLADALGIPEGSDLDTSAGVVRSRVEALRNQGVHFIVRFDGRLDPIAAQEIANDPSGIVPEAQDSAERRSGVFVRGDPPSVETQCVRLVGAVGAFLRTAVGLTHRMDEIIAVAQQFRSTGERLRAAAAARGGGSARAVDANFRDALDFLDGAAARATAEAESGLQMAVRIQNSATLVAP